MYFKKILFGGDSRDKMKAGIDKLANAVKVTLGPSGRNVFMENKFSTPSITKDGVTVARSINLSDAVENMGCQAVKEVALKTADMAGDGTTTATVLAQAIIAEGMTYITEGANLIDMKRGIDKAVAIVVQDLKEHKQDIKSDMGKLKMVATVSANGDESIGNLIGEAMEKIGVDGVVSVEDSKDTTTYTAISKGMEIDRGYTTDYLLTSAKRTIEFVSPLILITDERITMLREIEPMMSHAVAQKRPLLFIADIEGEALQTIILNVQRNGYQIAVIPTPSFGDEKKNILNDIAAVTGATVISTTTGLALKSATPTHLGLARTVTISNSRTTIVAEELNRKKIEARGQELKAAIAAATQDFDKERLKTRLAKLTNGVAVMYVGASSGVELQEKKDRIDDAVRATKAALEEGILPGGGVAYIHALKTLGKVFNGPIGSEDEAKGYQIVQKALEAPIRQIVTNAGGNADEVVKEVMKGTAENYNRGYNARSGQYVDMIKDGIVDPAKVARVALENAASIAGLFLTSECAISFDDMQEMGN